MARRTKQTVWHKKTQKFISPTLLKPHHSEPSSEPAKILTSNQVDRRKVFAKRLVAKIRSELREKS